MRRCSFSSELDTDMPGDAFWLVSLEKQACPAGHTKENSFRVGEMRCSHKAKGLISRGEARPMCTVTE